MIYEANMNKLKNLDEEEFAKLFKHFTKGVLSYLKKKYNISDALADDIWQDTLIKLIENISTIKDVRHLSKWLFRVCNTTTLDIFRKKEYQNMPLSVNLKESLEIDQTDSTQLIDINLKKRVIDSITTLPPSQKDIVFMKFYQNYSISEIANENNIPKGTVKSRLNRAKSHIKEQIEHFQ